MSKFKQRTHDTCLKHVSQIRPEVAWKHILLGDSMFERLVWVKDLQPLWQQLAKLDVLNMGVGGDRICNLLYRLIDMDVLSHFADCTPPTSMLIMIGSNDVEQVKLPKIPELEPHIRTIIDICRKKLPATQIHLLAIPPRFSRHVPDDEMIKRCITYNNMLTSIAHSTGIPYHDFWQMYNTGSCVNLHERPTQPMENDNTLFCDEVHFNDIGYQHFVPFLINILTTPIPA